MLIPQNSNGEFVNQQLMNEALQMKSHFENNSNELQYILHQNPELAQAVLSDNIHILMDYLAKIVKIRIFFSYSFLI